MLRFTKEEILEKGLSFLLVGVGGQGTIMASNILAEAGLNLGFDVKKAEIHGMSQRGGSVISQLRWGKKIYSPIVPEGQADFLVAFEKLEAGRFSKSLIKNGIALVNDQKLSPITVSAGSAGYPTDAFLKTKMSAKTGNVYWINAAHLAEELGNVKTANIILMGALSEFIAEGPEAWKDAIQKRVPEKHIAINFKAFEIGRNIITQ